MLLSVNIGDYIVERSTYCHQVGNLTALEQRVHRGHKRQSHGTEFYAVGRFIATALDEDAELATRALDCSMVASFGDAYHRLETIIQIKERQQHP